MAMLKHDTDLLPGSRIVSSTVKYLAIVYVLNLNILGVSYLLLLFR